MSFRTVGQYRYVVKRFQRLTGTEHSGKCDTCQGPIAQHQAVELKPTKYLTLLFHEGNLCPTEG